MYEFRYVKSDGTPGVFSFPQTWDEVQLDWFLEWRKASERLERAEACESLLIKDLQAVRSEYEYAFFHSEYDEEKQELLQRANEISARLKKHQNEAMLPCFLACAAAISGNDIADTALIDLQLLKDCVTLLSKQPLPSEAVKRLVWQKLTDAELSELSKQYDSLKFWQKWSKSGRELKRKIRDAKKADYSVRDIWDNSTFANKQARDAALQCADLFDKNNDWNALKILISLMFVESDNDAAELQNIRNGIGQKAYLENYAAVYKRLFERKYALFFGQKKTLSVGTVMRLRAFFLTSAEK